MGNIFTSSTGFFRTLGSLITFFGVNFAPAIPAIAPFATGIVAVGAAVGGFGVVKAGIIKAVNR